VSKFDQNISFVQKQMAENLEDGLHLAGLTLQAEAQRLCPVDTGALRASAFTRKSKKNKSLVRKVLKMFGVQQHYEIEVEVGFTQDYGVYVHENVGANFTVGQAKFLEQPSRTLATRLGSVIAASMKSGNVSKPNISDDQV